jgi:hypothetical protein
MITNAFLVQQLQRLSLANQNINPHLTATRRTAPNAGEGVVLCNVRNEMPLLPAFLNHYRAIGVRRFAFVDNGSTDGTAAFLLDQADCDLFEIAGRFRESGHGMIWKNLLILHYLGAKWHLSVDVDEHAVYDGWPSLGLDEFATRMSARGHSAVTAVMVDMYGPGPVAKAKPARDGNLLKASPLFDGDGYRVIPPASWREEKFPRLRIQGGPLARVFAKAEHGLLAKTPLVLEPNIYFLDPHTVLPVGLNMAAPGMALLHFRFTAQLPQKIAAVLAQRSHTNGSLDDYQKLAVKMQEDAAFGFSYPGSLKFQSPAQFVERQMIGAGNPAQK